MKLLRLLIPAPLHRLDLHLQQGYPRLWSTRIHHHLWFLLLVNVVVFALGLLLNVTTASFPDPSELFGYMLLPALVYFVCWVYKVVLFSPEKRFALRNPVTEVGEFLIHLVSIVLIMSIPYTLALTVTYRIAHTVSDRQFVADVDALNRQAWAFIEGDARSFGPHTVPPPEYLSGSSSHTYFRSLSEYSRPPRYGLGDEQTLQQVLDEYRAKYNAVSDVGERSDPEAAAVYRARIDSIEHTFPLFFTGHGCFTPHRYWYQNSVLSGSDSRLHFMNDSLLELQYVQDVQAIPLFHEERLQQALELGRKYGSGDTVTAQQVMVDFNAKLHSSSSIRQAAQVIERIDYAKNGSYSFLRWPNMAYSLLIPAFILALLLSMFRTSYWQPFLILLVACALLPVVILIAALILTEGYGEDRFMTYTYYVLGVVLLILAPGVMGTKAYRTRNAVVVMLANLAAPFMIFFTLYLLEDRFDVFGVDALGLQLTTLPENTPAYVAMEQQLIALKHRVDLILTTALWGGMVLYALLLHPLFRTLYVRLFALPETR